MLADAREQVALFDGRLRRIDNPLSHPWRAVGLTRLSLESKQTLRTQLHGLRGALADVRAAAASLASWLERPAPPTFADLERLLAIANVLGDTPAGVEAGTWSDNRWSEAADRLVAG